MLRDYAGARTNVIGITGQKRAFEGMAGGNGSDRRGNRLKSWKEIAAFFDTDERTVRRWQERGLPVHRVPGGARPTVYADVDKLEAWFRGSGDPSEDAAREVAAPEAAAASPSRERMGLLAALAALLLLGAGAYGFSQGSASPQARHQPPQKAADLYLAGTYDFERRTPASLHRAVERFGQAIAEDPAYAEAYTGLANTYLLLREHAGMADAEAYPRAREAAERALALDPDLAQAHAARAFVTFYWERDWARGLAGFDRAIALDPAASRAHHWRATALYHARRIEEALAAINEAQRRDPQSRAILADKALILFHAGRTPEALAILRPMAASEPEFRSAHAYLAIIHQAEGRPHDYLRETMISARLVGNQTEIAMLEAAQRALDEGGPGAMWRSLLAHEQGRRRAGGGSAYALAAIHATMGERDAALRDLQASSSAREPGLLSVRMDPMFRPLHRDPAFQRLAAQIGRPG